MKDCPANTNRAKDSCICASSNICTMSEYYASKLSSENLKRCYAIAPQRIQRYLKAEIQHVLSYVRQNATVLELGCGYGRVLSRMTETCSSVVGIDLSRSSLVMANHLLGDTKSILLAQMNAVDLSFADNSFDIVFCIQNGISAFKVEPSDLILEACRVAKPNGICLFSSYSPKIWHSRLEWFILQSEAGLIGEMDWDLTGNGIIVCKDGFKATTFTEHDFVELLDGLGLQGNIVEVDSSSVFCEIIVRGS